LNFGFVAAKPKSKTNFKNAGQRPAVQKPEPAAFLLRGSTGIPACANVKTQRDRATPARPKTAFFRFLVSATPPM
jgi:hypothetical protein